jgi:hypothetical protein
MSSSIRSRRQFGPILGSTPFSDRKYTRPTVSTKGVGSVVATLAGGALRGGETGENAGSAARNEKKKVLEQALTKGEQVGSLILNGKPQINYLDCYGEGFFSRFQIFAIIQELAGKLGLSVGGPVQG